MNAGHTVPLPGRRTFRLRERDAAAFTLIEILLASLGAALIFAAIYGVFANAMHLRQKATDRTRDAQLRARTYNVIRNDLRDAQITGGVLAASLTTTQTSSQSQFPGYVKFTTANADIVDGQVGGDVQEIEYYIVATPDSTDRTSGTLVRTVNRNLLAVTQELPPQQMLLDGVASMEVDFFDGSTWQTSWTLASPNDTLPEAVRIHIERAGKDGPVPPIDVTVPWTTTQFIGTSTTSTSTSTGASGS